MVEEIKRQRAFRECRQVIEDAVGSPWHPAEVVQALAALYDTLTPENAREVRQQVSTIFAQQRKQCDIGMWRVGMNAFRASFCVFTLCWATNRVFRERLTPHARNFLDGVMTFTGVCAFTSLTFSLLSQMEF